LSIDHFSSLGLTWPGSLTSNHPGLGCLIFHGMVIKTIL